MGNYEKLNLVNGTPFAAEHVAHMENGIAAVEAQATVVAGNVAAVAGNVAALGKEVEELKKNPGTGGGEGGGASLPEAGPYQYLVTDGNGQWGTADRLAYGEEHSVVLSKSGGVAFEGEDKGEGAPSYYLVYAGNVSDEAWNNVSVTDPSGVKLEASTVENKGNRRYFVDENYNYTVLCRFDGNETVNNSSGNITPDAGIYWRTGYNEMGGNGNTVNFGFVKPIDPKFLPASVVPTLDIDLEYTWELNSDGSGVDYTKPVFTPNKIATFDEIANKLLAGEPLRVRCNARHPESGAVFPCISWNVKNYYVNNRIEIQVNNTTGYDCYITISHDAEPEFESDVT